MISFREKKMDKLHDNFISRFFRKLIVRQILLAIVVTALVFFMVVSNIAPEKIVINVGDTVPNDIRATKDIIDEQSTEELRAQAIAKVEPREKIDPSVQVKVKNQIKSFFDLIYSMLDYNDISQAMKLSMLNQQSTIPITEVEYLVALNTNKETLQKMESNIYDIIGQIMGTGIKAEEIENEKQEVIETFNSLEDLSDSLKGLGISIVNNTIKPNRTLDVETTEQKKEEASNSIAPVVVKKGQLIARKGDIVDEKVLELIRTTGLLKEKEGIDYAITAGALLLVILLELIAIAYLYIFDRETLNNMRLLIILSIISISIIVISKSIFGISGYLIPVSAATMLISILINAKLAILINFILAIIIGLVTGNDINIMIMTLIGGAVGAFGVINTHQRYSILVTGVAVSLANVLTIVAFGLIGDVELKLTMSKSMYGFLNGIFSAILTIGSLPLWESVFGIVTPLKLLELSNPNHPLLKRLLLETPGTYHHSILVGNLSEAAIEAIDGNTLVARVGAYYHDVGKLKRPYFFKENQLGGDNPHDKLNPSLSTLIITNHVKDGVEMAKKYKLPKIIQDIIEQHHGDTLVAYFYHKAMSKDNSENIQEENFRYGGPKPQTREAAIIMLADSVEAAVRSIQEPTKGKIEGLVRQIIKDKLNDGQLDESDLTLKDLDTVANSFSKILFGIFHERIEYPKLDLNELKGGK